MAYNVMVERSKEAARDYYRTHNPSKYLEMITYESKDMDNIPDIVEEVDLNPKTTWYRFNYPDELLIIGSEKRWFFPYT